MCSTICTSVISKTCMQLSCNDQQYVIQVPINEVFPDLKTCSIDCRHNQNIVHHTDTTVALDRFVF